MTATKSAFGFQPVRIRGNAPNSNGLETYTVGASAGGTDIGDGDPVKMIAGGQIALASATTDYVIGVAKGFKWVDPVTKRPTWSNYLPANTSSADSKIYAYVVDAQNARFVIQADATVSSTDIGLNYSVSVNGVNAGGRSQCVLKASTKATATLLVRLLGLYETPDNAYTDAFPLVEVGWVQHRDAVVSAF